MILFVKKIQASIKIVIDVDVISNYVNLKY